MKVDLMTETNSDLTVVNAARCSFDKEGRWETKHTVDDTACVYNAQGGEIDCCKTESHWQQDGLMNQDVKLINYLAAHKHWTPFAHPQEVFMFDASDGELAHFFMHANLSGFEWVGRLKSFGRTVLMRGSLYAWMMNWTHLPNDVYNCVYEYIQDNYPVSFSAFYKGIKSRVRRAVNTCGHVSQSHIDEMVSYTLRIHAPIFVKRQLETHRRGFVMTDIEDFAQNEVSRRYIDSEPEFYTPEEWRIQAKDKKQGSSDEKLSDMHRLIARQYYNTHMYNCGTYYDVFNAYSIAHEQSRMVLPLSTYTTWWWTGSIKSWKRMAALRLEEHAQGETRELAQLICEAIPVPLT